MCLQLCVYGSDKNTSNSTTAVSTYTCIQICNSIMYIIESVDSISRDERDFH